MVAVNDSWRLVPFADLLYACDGEWWKLNAGVPGFAGLKVTQDEAALRMFPDLQKVIVRRGRNAALFDRAGILGDGGNSGFQAFNLVAQLAPRQIALVGFDMRLDKGLHWHGRHARGLNNPSESNMPRWRSAFMAAAPVIAARGIDVINCNPDSALTAFRFASLGALDVGTTDKTRRPRRETRGRKKASAH